MADVEENRKVKAVSEFLRNSCRVRPLHRLAFAKFFDGLSYPITHPVDGNKCKLFPTTTGSVAEFYIEPMLSCIGDTDVMYYYSSELAIPKSHPPPTQLPKDFEDQVKVYEIVDSHLPGYVFLNLTYILSRDRYKHEYVVTEYVSSAHAMFNNKLHFMNKSKVEVHGPAYMFIRKSLPQFLRQTGFTIDTVPCMHCFVWPSQAADWPKRHRSYGWPDSATVDCVVGNGCDVVGVAHRHCREDEWMSKHQWRLSFSRAEIVLLNSWMPVQQIVYHVLRVFAKTERLTGSTVNSGGDTMCNYHIKTSMLWACELKPQHWWNDGSTLVRKCLHLLRFLVEWLSKMRGQHYFINSVHFYDYFDKFHTDTISAVAKSSTEDSLATWFVHSYIRQCAKLCPDSVSIVYSDLLTSEVPTDMLSAIMQWRDHVCTRMVVTNTMLLLVWCPVPFINCFKTTFIESPSIIQDQHISSIVISLPQIDERALQVACDMLLMKKHNQKHLTAVNDFIAHIICGSCSSNDERRKLQCFSLESSAFHNVSHFRKAVILMQLVANKHRNTRELLLVELSKLSLQSALQYDNPERDSVSCLALMYLSVLYYTTGQYQEAIDHLTLTMKLQGRSQCCKCTSHIVEGKILPKIDANIDSALGLVVFYQYILTMTLNQQSADQVGVFTLELFAHYFTIKHLLTAKCHYMPKTRQEEATQAVQCSLHEELQSCCSTVLSSAHLLTSDLMLCKLASNSYHRGRTVLVTRNSISGIDRKQIVDLMTDLSLHELLTYRHLILARDTQAVIASNRSDFIALYLYRCQFYEECELMCRQVVRRLIDADSCNVPRLSIVYHEFLQLMDDDVVSLIGLTLLIRKTGTCSCFRGPVTVTQLTLSLYLLIKCQFRLRKPGGLGTLAVMLDWIATALKTIPVSECVDHLMLKLAERRAVMHITWRLSGSGKEEKLYVGECKLDIAYDVSRGLRLEIAHTYTDAVLRSRLRNGDWTVWVGNGVGEAWPLRSFVDLIRLRNEQSADVLKEFLQKQVQIYIPITLPISLLQRFVSR